MTFPPPHPAAQNSIASGTSKSSGARPARAQPSAWGLPAPASGARRGLTPLATDLGSSSLEPTGRPTSTASPFTSTFSSVLNSSSRNSNSRNTYSTPSTISPFSPSQSGSQSGSQQTPQLLLSPRSRAITPSSNSYLASSTAASTTASQGGGGSASGGGSQRNQAFSPSSQLQSLNSPTNNTFDRSTFGGPPSSSGNSSQSSVSKIVVTQVFLLLGSITEKEGKAKWDSQAEAIHKVLYSSIRSVQIQMTNLYQLVESNGMEVFSKYFRRLLVGNSPQIFPGINRNVENPGNYQLLVQEMEKITQTPEQAPKIAEIVDTSEGDIFRDFDLGTFMDHFKLNALAKNLLASAFTHVSKPDLKTKGRLHRFLLCFIY